MVRFKNRYFVIEINQEHKSVDNSLQLKPASLYNAILEAVQKLHGDFGVAAIRAGFITKYCNEKTRIAIIRVRHGPHRIVASCLPFINKLEAKAMSLTTLYTGATMRHCFEFIRRHQRKCLNDMYHKLKCKGSFESMQQFEQEYMDIKALDFK